MKYLDEFRRPDAASRIAAEIRAAATRPRYRLMEVCGTHTVFRSSCSSGR